MADHEAEAGRDHGVGLCCLGKDIQSGEFRSAFVCRSGANRRTGIHRVYHETPRRLLHVRFVLYRIQNHEDSVWEGYRCADRKSMRRGRYAARLLLFASGYAPSGLPGYHQVGQGELARGADAPGMADLSAIYADAVDRIAHPLWSGCAHMV